MEEKLHNFCNRLCKKMCWWLHVSGNHLWFSMCKSFLCMRTKEHLLGDRLWSGIGHQLATPCLLAENRKSLYRHDNGMYDLYLRRNGVSRVPEPHSNTLPLYFKEKLALQLESYSILLSGTGSDKNGVFGVLIWLLIGREFKRFLPGFTYSRLEITQFLQLQ